MSPHPPPDRLPPKRRRSGTGGPPRTSSSASHHRGATTSNNNQSVALDKLLQRLTRAPATNALRPPDSASDRLGREIGRAALSPSDVDRIFDAMVQTAQHAHLPPSVPHAVLEELVNRTHGDVALHDFAFLVDWLIRSEELCASGGGGGHHRGGGTNSTAAAASSALRHLWMACVRAYAMYLATQTTDHHQRGGKRHPLLDVYRRLQWDASRSLLVQHLLGASHAHKSSHRWGLLSPLLAVAVLAGENHHTQEEEDASSATFTAVSSSAVANLHLVWRSLLWKDDPTLHVHQSLQWMKFGLEIHAAVLDGGNPVAAHRLPTEPVDLSLAREWWTLLVHQSLGFDLSPLLFQLAPACATQGQDWLPESALAASAAACGCFPLRSPTDALRWVVLPLAVASTSVERRLWLQLILEATVVHTGGTLSLASASAVPQEGGSVLAVAAPHWSSVALLHALAVIGAEWEDCGDVAAALLERLAQLQPRDEADVSAPPEKPTECLIQLLEQPTPPGGEDWIDALASRSFEPTHGSLSETQQVASLLLGTVVWERDETVGAKILSNLLEFYPHLAVSLLPVVLDRIHAASLVGDGPSLLRCLEFMSRFLVRDAACAVEVWNVLTQMLSPQLPLAVRVTAIRLLPAVVQSNSRLYRRVLDVLGAALASRSDELRLAVAATLCDLAQHDAVADVSDVIGWIQSWLVVSDDRTSVQSPMRALLIHFGILTLHHLVVAGDLTFDVVVKVLNKRLLRSGVTDLEAVLALPAVVQEALVLLLGDGECGSGSSSEEESESAEDDDDDEEEEGSSSESGNPKKAPPSIAAVSPQVSSSVRALIRLGSELHEQQERQPWDATQVRIVQNLYGALAGYSLDALGLTAEGIQSVMSYFEQSSSENMALTEAGERYISLRNLVLAGMSCVNGDEASNDDSATEPIVRLAHKLLEFEEDAIGSALWKKHGRRYRSHPSSSASAKSAASTRLERGVASVLPDPVKVQQLAAERSTSPGAAIAFLLASDGTNLSVIRDNGDATLDTTDPLFLVFMLQAYLHAVSSVVSRYKREDLGKMIVEVESWNEVFVSPDTMYMSLAVVAIYIPYDLLEDGAAGQRSYVDKISGLLMDAYKNSKFERNDVGKLCLGLVAVSNLRSGSLELVLEVVDTLEQSVKGYGGRHCFGAYYGLGLVCQGLRRYLDSDAFRLVVPDAKRMIYRICGFLVEEILSCYEERTDIFGDLVACIKSGTATSDLVDSMSDLDASSISLLMTKQVKARYLFISCALCLPALSGLNGALHLAALRLMESFEWGGGKGISLPPMLRACQSTDLFEAEELKQIYTSFAQTFEDRMDCQEGGIDAEGLDDIFYAFNGTTSNPTSHIIRRTLVGNRDLFDDDGCVLSLIAMTVSIAPVPCLGASFFVVPVDIRAEAAKSDVESVVEIIRDATNLDTDSKYSDMGLILMAYLASMKNERELGAVEFSLPVEVEKGDLIKEKGARSSIDFDKVPSPHAETALGGLLELIERFDLRRDRKDRVLSRVMAALETLSLPDGFAKSFIEPLLKSAKGHVSRRCVSLLCSQVGGRRRAVFGGRDFMLLALKLANLKREDWDDMGGNGGAFEVFLDCLPEVAKKFPPDSTENVLEKLWKNCIASFPSDTHIVCKFLSSACIMLGCSALAPKTTKYLRHIVIQAARDLPEYPFEALLRSEGGSTKSVIASYVQCLVVLPLEILDEDEFFNILKSFDGFDVDAVKVMALIELIGSSYFDSSTNGREELELTNAMSWISKALQSSGDNVSLYAFRHILQVFAKVSTRESAASKKKRLSTILDVLLQTKRTSSRLAIQWLSVVVAYWCQQCGSDGRLTLGVLCVEGEPLVRGLAPRALEQSFELLVQDLPFNLAAFAADQKISAIVTNQLFRLHEAWSEQKADKDVLNCLRTAFFACYRNSRNQEAFTSLSSSLLCSSLLT